MAALEVVKKRLDETHLGLAVLELHSHKSTKKSVLASIAESLDQGRPQTESRQREWADLAASKTHLDGLCARYPDTYFSRVESITSKH
ncbi:MAG: hypothetical protein U5L01_05065 [Rheinheimera sp.]|nr:hypothetical protein [Rheinheimera sp.]